jgi:hypothetical protein
VDSNISIIRPLDLVSISNQSSSITKEDKEDVSEFTSEFLDWVLVGDACFLYELGVTQV